MKLKNALLTSTSAALLLTTASLQAAPVSVTQAPGESSLWEFVAPAGGPWTNIGWGVGVGIQYELDFYDTGDGTGPILGTSTLLANWAAFAWAADLLDGEFSVRVRNTGSFSGLFMSIFAGWSGSGTYVNSEPMLITAPANVPEPGALALVAVALAGLGLSHRRR